MEIAILTNLPQTDAPASLVAELYRNRWSIETLFLTITENFNGEIQTLAYPKAALFSFSMALVAYNICHPTCCVGQRAWSWQSSGRVI